MVNSISGTSQISLARFDDMLTKFQASNANRDNSNSNERKNLETSKVEISRKQEAVKQQVDFSQIEEGIKELLKDDSIAIEFSKDDESKQMIMKIINDQTKEVIRQFPAEISLKIARIISQNLELKNIADLTV